jgi:hypothetical protein
MLCHSERSEESQIVSEALITTNHKSEMFRFAQHDRAETLQHLNEVNASLPFRHLLRERALCAIGIVLHTKVFVDLEQPLLVRDRAQKFLPAGVISKKTRGSGFESPVR